MTSCIFCDIVAGEAAAGVVYQDGQMAAFMTLQPTRPGECLIIPTTHIDHFTDMDEETAARIMVLGLRIGRKMMDVFRPLRVGMVVHGFGVPHAHLILVPQHDPYDITSARFASIEEGEIVFDLRYIPQMDREVLDEHAHQLRIDQIV
jgi:histidine triad (HIT) family protein